MPDVSAPSRAPALETRAPAPWGSVGVLTVFVLLIVGLLAWREAVYYTGGTDPVVVAKAVLAVLALGLAWVLAPGGALGRLRPRSIGLIVTYVGVSLVGALAGGNAPASAVLALRMLMVLATMAFLVVSCPPSVLVRSFAAASAGVGLLLAASGLPTLLAGDGPNLTAGRLTGVLLPTSPNQLAMLFAPPALVLAWRVAAGRSRAWHVGLLALLVGLTWMTGSRAGLIALVLGFALILATAPRKSLGVFAGLLMCAPTLFYVVAFTTSVSDFFGRGGTESVLTLNSRTTAWSAAFELAQDFFTQWFGQGLAVKSVPVRALYVDTQVLDSTWVSAFVQAGAIGLGLLALWAFSTLFRAARDRSPYAMLWLALAGYAVSRSVLENGLIDTYVLFVVMLVPALSLDLSTADEPRRAGSRLL